MLPIHVEQGRWMRGCNGLALVEGTVVGTLDNGSCDSVRALGLGSDVKVEAV
jgi:hypothetical protein